MIKSYDELTFADDFLFCKILYDNKELCKELLSLILGRKVRDITYASKQESIEITSNSKGVRLDVYLEDDIYTVYDIEMQTTISYNLPKRTRYYQGMIDLNLLSRGLDYDSLRTSYIIFICLKDPFGVGKAKYTFTNRCKEFPSLELGDDTTKIFLNANGDLSDSSDELINFMNYLSKKEVRGTLMKKLDKEVQKAKLHDAWKVEYMSIYARDRDKFIEGRAEGHAEGRNVLFNAIIKLRSGTTKEELLSNGYDEDTVDMALKLI